ncbi:MAG: hypothetical protein IPH85_06060 [Ignavibacteria bacterium]|nr:hypothetical protein [Ignavibacteria bacterium]
MNILADWPWLPPAIACGVSLVFLMIRYPKVWLGMFLVALPYFLTDTGKGLSVTEVVAGGLFTSTILMWMFWRIVVDPRPLVKGWTDFLLLFFIVAAFANIIIAKLNYVGLMGWAVDWSYFLLMLYYFPFREEFGQNKRTFNQFLVLSGISSTLMALYSTYNFKQRMAENMVYAYQIMSSRSAVLGPIFLLSICITVVVILFATRNSTRLIAVGVTLVNLVALGLTFTRTLWVMVFFCIFLAMVFMRYRQNMRLLIGSTAILSMLFLTMYIVYPKITVITAKYIQVRFASSTQITGGDLSFETRILEANNAWRKVKEAPLGGNGLRARFVTWAPIEQWHNSTAFIHIGYIGIIHKLGFPTAFIIFSVLIGFALRAFRNAWEARTSAAAPLVRALAIGTFAFIPAVFVNIFMAGIFDQRYGNVMFAFIFASVAISEEFLRRARIEPSTDQHQ